MVGFNLYKTVQAASYLVKNSGSRINYMKLLKLLYLADRKSLKDRRRSICGDQPFAMKRGPVLSRTLDLIKGADPQSRDWEQFLRRDNYYVFLVSDPGNLELSRADLSILDDVIHKFGAMDEWELVEWCHDNLPEYENNWNARGAKDSKRIPLDDILNEIGRPGEAADIIREINENAKYSNLFGDHMPEPT